MASIEMKPEAPWIRRTDQGVIFTDEVVKYDIELSQSSSSSDSEDAEEEPEQADDLFEGAHYARQHDLSDGYPEEEEIEEAANQRMTADQLKTLKQVPLDRTAGVCWK